MTRLVHGIVSLDPPTILLDAKEARPTTDLGLDLPLTLEGTDR